MATLDTRTSTICQELDNEVFELKDRQVGKNFPPMHPQCRSKTRAYMGEEIEKTLKRRARNPITNKTETVGNVSYKEWTRQNGLLTNNVNSSIMNERSKRDIANITDIAISKVPKIEINGYTNEQNGFIQEQHKELLRYARDKNDSNEVAFVFRKDLTDKTIVVGTDKQLNITEALRGKGEGLFVMHNHPRNSPISYDDILEFITGNELSTMSIVKNSGSVELVSKSSHFDNKTAMSTIERAVKKYVKIGTDAEYELAVKKALYKLQKEKALQWIVS